ncbi:MAG TPA: TM1802 family CRISPR-associated protein [Vicinamibacterales bacterium]|nr:TM1802 family CRISPR-associated protein [Vicinamibacterales bacterium]
MIHQFAELGQFFQQREGLSEHAEDRLRRFAHDPGAKFRTNTVLLLVFNSAGFDRVHVEEYDEARRLWYLYRPGPPNGCDATPTSGVREIKERTETALAHSLREELTRKVVRLSRSITDAIAADEALASSEMNALTKMRDWLRSASEDTAQGREALDRLLQQVQLYHPATSTTKGFDSRPAIISVGWRDDAQSPLKRVGDFSAFRRRLAESAEQSLSKNKAKGAQADIKGVGQCCICGRRGINVFGRLKLHQFNIYHLDKRGSISGGFDESTAWRNFPACRECCERVDFAGERVKKELAFDFYGFKYLVLPAPVQEADTQSFELLPRLIAARVNEKASVRLTAAEDELFYVISQENNLLQVDLLFYRPDPQSFRPALYVSGLLPSRFRKLFEAKDKVDRHPWLVDGEPTSFVAGQFSFGSLRKILPAAHGGSTFDDDFLAATRVALELRRFPAERLYQIGMRWVYDDCIEDGAPRKGRSPRWHSRLADLFRSLLFFEVLTGENDTRSVAAMNVDYGVSDQAARVRKVLDQAPGKLRSDPAAQAAFLIGACCGRIELMQIHMRGSSPFAGKLKAFRLNQEDVRGLFVAAKEKAQAYGPEEERKVRGLLECAAAALLASPDRWTLSPNEVSYFFALGHALRPRLAQDTDSEAA